MQMVLLWAGQWQFRVVLAAVAVEATLSFTAAVMQADQVVLCR